jgi:membrane fusion protein
MDVKSSEPLFRLEVLPTADGENSFYPLQAKMQYATGICITLVVTIILFICFSSYTGREKVQGTLVPSTGVIEIKAMQSGTVTHIYTKEGEKVLDGQPLFSISSENSSESLSNTKSDITSEINSQISRARKKLFVLGSRQDRAVTEDALKEENYKAQLNSVGEQIRLAMTTLKLAQVRAKNLMALEREQYVSTKSLSEAEEKTASLEANLSQLFLNKLQLEDKLLDLARQTLDDASNFQLEIDATQNEIASYQTQLLTNEAS